MSEGLDPRTLYAWVDYLRHVGVQGLAVPDEVPEELRAFIPKAQRRGAAAPVGGRREPLPTVASPDDALAQLRQAVAPQAAAKSSASSRPRVPAANAPVIQGSGFDNPPPADPAKRLVEIREELGDCTRCKLHSTRNKIVFGVGDPAAKLFFVGEGPGRDEDLKGEPFVGRAGQKLDEMIKALKLERSQVYIANVVKCRPPNNRDPEADEVTACSPFLFKQIEAIRPKVIVTLGGPATKLLLKTRVGITKLRGTWQTFHGIPVMPTFHPAYMLRNYTREVRGQVWSDLKQAYQKVTATP